MWLRELGCGLGNGLLSGFSGTLAITASQMAEMKWNGRGPSNSPAKVAEKLLDIEPKDGKAESLLTQLVHFAYGTGWGLTQPLLAAAGIRGPLAAIFHWGAVQQAALVLLPALKVAPPAKEWGRKAVGTEMVHHLVYAAAAAWIHGRVAPRSGSWLCRRKGSGGSGPGGAGLALLFGTALAAAFLAQAEPLPEKLTDGEEKE